MWGAIVRAGLTSAFARQRVYRDYYVDLCIPRRAIIEIDGPSHASQGAYDARRDAYFRERGYVVRRYTNAQVWASADRIARELGDEFSLWDTPRRHRPRPRVWKATDAPGRSAATAWLD